MEAPKLSLRERVQAMRAQKAREREIAAPKSPSKLPPLIKPEPILEIPKPMLVPSLEDVDELEENTYNDMETLMDFLNKFKNFISSTGQGYILDNILRAHRRPESKVRRTLVQEFLYNLIEDLSSQGGESSEEAFSPEEDESSESISSLGQASSEEGSLPGDPSNSQEEEYATREDESDVEFMAGSESDYGQSDSELEPEELADIAGEESLGDLSKRMAKLRLQPITTVNNQVPTWEDIKVLDLPQYNNKELLMEFVSVFIPLIENNGYDRDLKEILNEKDTSFRRERMQNLLSIFVPEGQSLEDSIQSDQEISDESAADSGEEPSLEEELSQPSLETDTGESEEEEEF